MPTERFENLAKHLADLLSGMLAKLKEEELAAAGFIRRVEIDVGFGIVERRVESIATAALDKIYDEFGKLSVADLMEELNARKAGQ